MKTKNRSVGLDVHKDSTVIAVADGGRDGEVRLFSEVSSDSRRTGRSASAKTAQP
jgi:hypothetical protein